MGFLFEAKDSASEAITKIKDNVEELGKSGEKTHASLMDSLGGVGKIAAATAVAVGVAAGATFELAEHASHFSEAIVNAGVAAHATKGQIEGLEKFAHDKALDSLGKSAESVAETLQELAREGFNVNESMTAVDSTMKLMRFSSMGARDAASLVHDTIAEFGMTAGQSGELVDKLAFAMREFHFRAEELRPAMAGLASGAHLANASFDDTLIGVGILKDAFPNATKAAMAMNIALQQIASTNTQKELRGIGVSVHDSEGHIRPLLEIIQDLSGKTANLSDAQLAHKLATIGSARAAGGLAVIIDQLRKGTKDASGQLVTGGAALDVYRDKLQNTAGTADGLVDLLNDTFPAAIAKVKNAISNLGDEIGSHFEGPWKNALATVNLFIRGVSQLFSQGGFSGQIKDELDKADNQGLKGFLIGLFVWGSRIKNFFEGLAESFHSAFAPFQPVIDAITARMGDLGKALGITGQGANDNADAFDKAGQVGGTVGDVLGNLAGILSMVVFTAIDLVTAAVQDMRIMWETIGPTIMNIGQILKGFINIVASIFTGDWTQLWNGFVDVVIGAAKIVTNLILGLVKMIAGLGDSIAQTLGFDSNMVGAVEGFQKDLMAKVDLGTTVIKTSPSSNPGVAAAQNVRAAAVAQAPAMSMSEPTEQTTHVHVHLDGEKVGGAIVKAKRSSEARSFMPVAHAEAGAF